MGDRLDHPVVSDKRRSPQQYHTHRCHLFPSEVRQMTEGDERREIRRCLACSAMADDSEAKEADA